MEGNRLKFPKNIAIDWVALVFEAAGDSSSCSIGFAKGVCGVPELSVPREKRNSRCCDAGRCWQRLRLCCQLRVSRAGAEAQSSGLSAAAPGPAGLIQPCPASHTGWVSLWGWPGHQEGQDRHTLRVGVASPAPGLSLTPS